MEIPLWPPNRSYRKSSIKFPSLFKTKRPFKLTKPGWIFILYTIGVGAGAINTGNNLLYLVFGVFLGMLLASGLLSDLSLWGVDIDHTFPHAAQAGQPMSIFLKITNTKKRLPSISVKVSLEGKLRGETIVLKKHVPFLSAKSTDHARLEWTFPVRGWFELSTIRLSTRYPFGLLEKWWRLKVQDGTTEGFFITPPTTPMNFSHLPVALAGEDRSSEQFERGDGTLLLGVHPFVPGDNPRRIHWKASAKRAPAFAGDSSAWLVREMNKDEKEEILFMCPVPASVGSISDAEADRLVSFIASAMVACHGAGYTPRLILSNAFVIDVSIFLALWDPRKPIEGLLEKVLERPIGPDVFRGYRTLDVMEAFRVSHQS